MNNYSQMSDFEINKAVAIATGHKCYYGDGSYTNDGKHVTVKGNGIIGWFRPCSEPGDAWPIITEHGIGVIPYKKGLAEAWSVATGLINGTTKDANPLRAAMVVFLMMQDKADANS